MGGQHTTPAEPGVPKPPCHKAHCAGHDTVRGSHHTVFLNRSKAGLIEPADLSTVFFIDYHK